MTKKFDFKQMLKEILEDEKLSQKQTKTSASQDEIESMMKARKARRNQHDAKNR